MALGEKNTSQHNVVLRKEPREGRSDRVCLSRLFFGAHCLCQRLDVSKLCWQRDVHHRTILGIGGGSWTTQRGLCALEVPASGRGVWERGLGKGSEPAEQGVEGWLCSSPQTTDKRTLTKLPGKRGNRGCREVEDMPARAGWTLPSGMGSVIQRSLPPTPPWMHPSTSPCTQPSLEPCPTRKRPLPPGVISEPHPQRLLEEKVHTCLEANRSPSQMGKQSCPNTTPHSPPGPTDSPAGCLTNIR